MVGGNMATITASMVMSAQLAKTPTATQGHMAAITGSLGMSAQLAKTLTATRQILAITDNSEMSAQLAMTPMATRQTRKTISQAMASWLGIGFDTKVKKGFWLRV